MINGRTAFLSYARGDERLAALIEEELGKLDVHVGRDSNLLKVGIDFHEALEREARTADCFSQVDHSARFRRRMGGIPRTACNPS